MAKVKRWGVVSLLLLNSGCTVMAVAGAAASVASTAASVTVTAVKTSAQVTGAALDAVIPDGEKEPAKNKP